MQLQRYMLALYRGVWYNRGKSTAIKETRSMTGTYSSTCKLVTTIIIALFIAACICIAAVSQLAHISVDTPWEDYFPQPIADGIYSLVDTFLKEPIVCYEDMPCWNCETMGNLICGPTAE